MKTICIDNLNKDFGLAIEFLSKMKTSGRNLSMPGDGRYQPEKLKAYLGYDQWAAWLIIVEWFWMVTLGFTREMPQEDAELLTNERLFDLLNGITTTMQDEAEKKTKHDIIALRDLMCARLPKQLHRWLHFGATSYDIISTAYALQAKIIFEKVFWPKIQEVDGLWRDKISETTNILQAGRTHLQTALPVTVGFWLACLHNRFANSARMTKQFATEIVGKFSGAVGTYASQEALMKVSVCEDLFMKIVGLPKALVSTQITPPEPMSRYYFELVLLSGAMANLGEDTRILQSSMCGEIISASSSSSAMAHKTANPIAAENVAGMHESVKAEFQKVMSTLVTDIQRDLRGSSVMRSQSAVMVYVFQQLKTTERLLKSLKANEKRCLENYNKEAVLLSAETIHLYLQREGFSGSHEFVNKTLISEVKALGGNLYDELMKYDDVAVYLEEMSPELVQIVRGDMPSLGRAVKIAETESINSV